METLYSKLISFTAIIDLFSLTMKVSFDHKKANKGVWFKKAKDLKRKTKI